jgi:diguanylate cyclase (GGDEF)-like protein
VTIRFARGNIKPDTPLLFLLPIFGILLLILIWSALTDFLASEQQRVTRIASDDAAGRARAYARVTDQTLRQIDQTLRLVQFEIERARQRGDGFDLSAVARRATAGGGMIGAIATVDRSGLVTAVFTPNAGAVPVPVGARIADGDDLRALREGEAQRMHVGRPIALGNPKRNVVPAMRRLTNPDGTLGGAVVAMIDPARLADVYADLNAGEQGMLGLLGEDGVYRAFRTGGTTSSGTAVGNWKPPERPRDIPARRGLTVDPVDGVSRFEAQEALPAFGVIAIAGLGEQEVLAEHLRQRESFIDYAIFASLAIVGVLGVAMLLVIRMKQSHREAEAARATYRAAAEGSLDAFFLLRALKGRDGTISEFQVEDANSRALALLKLSRDEVVGARLRALLPRTIRRRMYRRYFKVLETGQPIEEEIETAWDGRGARWFRHQVVPLSDGIAVTLRDIDDAMNAQRKLERAANLDSLTSLPNRRQFIEHAGSAIERCRALGTNLGVLFIDLDNFKNVNDTLGHDIGDLLLQAVAVRLQSCIRAEDILWRLGGDEFVVTMEHVRNRTEAEVVCRRICDVFAPPITIRETSISTSASIGVAFCPEDADDANTLLKNADLAMYHAKEFGSGAYQFFTSAMGSRRAARIDIEQDLRGALRRYELFLVYQPQIRLADGEVTGLEALVRWQHPEHGVMHPLDFIPIAEESNLIHLLGDYVFQIACAQIQRWQGMGLPPVTVCVNVSPRQFQWDGIAERLLSIIEASGVSPDRLQIELTESAIMTDLEAARRKLSELKRRGITLAVDDFGTGHSSLASLQSFPLDTLKIDRSFVERAGSQEGVAILRAIVLMAHTLRMNVVAEGVETEAQLELLRKIGCDEAQGFLIASPVLADEVPGLLARLDERTGIRAKRAYANS